MYHERELQDNPSQRNLVCLLQQFLIDIISQANKGLRVSMIKIKS